MVYNKNTRVAVLTRGRIYSDTDIGGLWKSDEIKSFAEAAYEWKYGSRKKACKKASKTSFQMIFGEDLEEYSMVQKIREDIGEEKWKDFAISILTDVPDVELGISEWVKEFSIYYCKIIEKYGLKICVGREIKDYFKIKTRDKNVPHFKENPVKKYFEKKSTGVYTRSSIHGVKGESDDAVLISIESRTGKTLTSKFLMEGNLKQIIIGK